MKILEICVDLDGGGIDRYLYNYCTRITDIHFDYSIVDNRKGMLEKPLEECGSVIYRVPRITDGIVGYYRKIKQIIASDNYDAIHVHLGYKSFPALIAAKRLGIKTRIAHAHIAFVPESGVQVVVRKVCTYLTKRYATHLAACGVDAGKWVWGEKAFQAGNVMVHNNAIHTSQYVFDAAKRRSVRKEYGIADDAVIVGHVGRLSDQKNQLRLLDIFRKIADRKPGTHLWLIGTGEQEELVKEKIKALGLEAQVKMLGVRDDVPDLLNAMDVFVFPSKYEGLPFTLIETQCNGLQSLSSDTITKYVSITNCNTFFSLSESDDRWAERALVLAERGHDADAFQQVVDAGYDIDRQASVLKEYYQTCIGGSTGAD